MKKILLMLLVLVFNNAMVAQVNTQPNDCVNAIVVCGNETFMSNASGAGKQEVAGCTGFEHNSLWMKVTIAQAGTLGFDLIPNDPSISVDYDFWVFGPGKTCGSLGSPTRCCTTNPQLAGLANNHTGMKDGLLNTVGGPGANGTGYVRSLNVNVGEVYYIVIDRPIGEGGFQVQWTGSATAGNGAFPTPPKVNKIIDQINCTSGTVGFFNLDLLKSQITSEPNTTITFYGSLANATDGTSPLPSLVSVSTGNPKPIFAKVVNNLGGALGNGCYSITDFNLKVFQVPTAAISVSKTTVCPGDNVIVTFTGTIGATVDYTVNGGPTQSVLLDTSTFLLSDSVSSDRTYTVTRAKIIDGNGKEVCFTDYTVPPVTNTVTVTVYPLPTITGSLTVCLNGTSQLTGSETPDATTPWTSSDTTIATIDSTGLVTGIAVGTSTITYTSSNGCSTTSVVTVSAGPTVTGKSSICASGGTQLTGSGTPAASNPWTSSDPTIATVTSSGFVNGVSIGTVTITYTDVTGCSATFSLNVTASNNTQTATAEVSNFFDENQTITVTVIGDAAVYLYSLDGGEFQTSNVFSHVAPGLHTVEVNDTQGCTELLIQNILAIGYPHFFTPNNDGYNDTWNITSLADFQPDAEIFIFDRYGKLLKRITPGGAGWDGTYNGQPMPSSDYWFTVKYLENGVQKLFKSHFSLKR